MQQKSHFTTWTRKRTVRQLPWNDFKFKWPAFGLVSAWKPLGSLLFVHERTGICLICSQLQRPSHAKSDLRNTMQVVIWHAASWGNHGITSHFKINNTDHLLRCNILHSGTRVHVNSHRPFAKTPSQLRHTPMAPTRQNAIGTPNMTMVPSTYFLDFLFFFFVQWKLRSVRWLWWIKVVAACLMSLWELMSGSCMKGTKTGVCELM